MSDAAQHGGSQFKFGNIENSTGFAIGNDAHVIVNQNLPAQPDEVRALLDDFIRLLGSYGNSVDDMPGIRESAELARDEMARSSPKWQAVRRMLTTIAASVAGVAALTDAINNIQALVARIG